MYFFQSVYIYIHVRIMWFLNLISGHLGNLKSFLWLFKKNSFNANLYGSSSKHEKTVWPYWTASIYSRSCFSKTVWLSLKHKNKWSVLGFGVAVPDYDNIFFLMLNRMMWSDFKNLHSIWVMTFPINNRTITSQNMKLKPFHLCPVRIPW